MKPNCAPVVARAMRRRSAGSEIPVVFDTSGTCASASRGEMSGSSPLPDVVTRSGVGSMPWLRHHATSSFVSLRSTAERGPRFVAADSPLEPFATSGLSPPAVGTQVDGEPAPQTTAPYGPVSSGRPLNQLVEGQ